MKLLIPFIVLFIVIQVQAQQKTIQEKLGYEKDTKLLIIHADDLGVSHSENAASFKALEKGMVNSASIMVPCPWLLEVAAYAKAHPNADLGLHLTLTSEWKNYKWGPVNRQVESLVTKEGYFTDGSVNLGSEAKIEDVERELRSQIEQAIRVGIQPTHFDSHMGMLFQSPELIQLYINLGREYKVPVLLNNRMSLPPLTDKDVLVDQVYIASPSDYKKSMTSFYTGVLKSIQPGLNEIIIHTAYDEAEMQAVTIGHPDYGSAWRQADYNFFTSEACKKIIVEQKIQLITWKEIRDKLLR
ncbi:polysaccharide deacetylase family protein [Chryseosolibacter indicus]|uniref:Polysaccharide deacetylase family protein n=1 Tax=Chryseosolibacter indicus TaxID=2782351 RepID=A0ABS5VUM3_9BACT|nr:polysaccharide deacetylase family protein [Chryseosolibacter indicus]MBT1705036.1 polysaccharide deacetylase family protein [Chryseosolibacter indicus]